MDSEHLKLLGEEIAKTLDAEGQPLFEIKLQIGRLISHLESEQRVTVRMEKQMDVHEKALFGDQADLKGKPGIVNGVNKLVESYTEGRKRHNAVLMLLIALVITKFAEILFHVK